VSFHRRSIRIIAVGESALTSRGSERFLSGHFISAFLEGHSSIFDIYFVDTSMQMHPAAGRQRGIIFWVATVGT
jgi:hypothetical protein